MRVPVRLRVEQRPPRIKTESSGAARARRPPALSARAGPEITVTGVRATVTTAQAQTVTPAGPTRPAAPMLPSEIASAAAQARSGPS